MLDNFSKTSWTYIFTPPTFISDLFKVFGFSVTLLFFFSKTVIFSNLLDFRLQYLFCHLWGYFTNMIRCMPDMYTAYLLRKFRPKIQNWQFMLKFDTRAEYAHFFCFRLKMLLLGKFGTKDQNCQFKLKFGTNTNLNFQYSMVIFKN